VLLSKSCETPDHGAVFSSFHPKCATCWDRHDTITATEAFALCFRVRLLEAAGSKRITHTSPEE
jgi:hypothetical protein